MNKAVRFAAKILKNVLGEGFYRHTNVIGHTLEAWVAAAVNGFPGYRLKVIGITGTNGKTTTANFLASILKAAGLKPGVSTTANFRIGDEEWENELNMTVTDPWKLQKLLKRMRQSGVDQAVLEVTSHSMHQGRVAGIRFNTAVMTNLAPDHLDYHGTIEAYASAKAKLLKKAREVVVLNHDDDWYDYYLKAARHAVYTYGVNEESAVRLDQAQLHRQYSDIRFRYGQRIINLRLKLPGKFNAYNALAAATVAFGLDIDWKHVKEGLERLEGVPGRMETIQAGQDFAVIVDYAHTPDAFENVFDSLKPLSKGKIIAVFGGAPMHDYQELGRVAGRMADTVIVTDDEPMDTDPEMIRASIVAAAKDEKHAQVYEVSDRKQGIKKALELAGPKDTVALLGLGHQKYRRIGSGQRIKWDDRAVTKELLEQNRPVTTSKNHTRQ